MGTSARSVRSASINGTAASENGGRPWVRRGWQERSRSARRRSRGRGAARAGFGARDPHVSAPAPAARTPARPRT
eukprot:759201-Rhodomonas_salina.1